MAETGLFSFVMFGRILLKLTLFELEKIKLLARKQEFERRKHKHLVLIRTCDMLQGK